MKNCLTKIEKEIPFEQYFFTKALSASTLKRLQKTPLHAITPKKDTKPMAFGRATHSFLLTPELNNVFVADGRTNEGKEKIKRYQEVGKESHRVTAKEMETLSEMAEVLKTEKISSRFFSGGDAEVSVFWEKDSVPCKCRMDYVRRDIGIIGDYKTTKDASIEGFAKEAINSGYDIQAAFYLEAAQFAWPDIKWRFLIVAQEKEPPYDFGLYNMAEFLELGREKVNFLFEKYKECIKSGNWHGYSKNVEILPVPTWAQKKGGIYE